MNDPGPDHNGGTTPNSPSLFLPFVHATISRERVRDCINAQGWGVVEDVVLRPLPLRPGKLPVNKAFVHFRSWSDTAEAQRQRQAFLNLKDKDFVKIVYNAPWFWKAMACASHTPTGQPWRASDGAVRNGAAASGRAGAQRGAQRGRGSGVMGMNMGMNMGGGTGMGGMTQTMGGMRGAQ